MAEDKVVLFCQILDDGDPFSVELERSKSVDVLKDRIKEKRARALSGIDAADLKLWKVNYDVSEGPLTSGIFDTLDRTDMLAWKKVKIYFPDEPVEEHIHVVVRQPPGAC